MTTPARIKQCDVERFTKGVMAAGVERVRIVADLATGRIEAIIGGGDSVPPPAGPAPWDEDEDAYR